METIAIDQHGQIHYIGQNPPRKWLLNYFGRKHAEKMYCDTKSGKIKHVGYIIAGLWLSIYYISEWKKAK